LSSLPALPTCVRRAKAGIQGGENEKQYYVYIHDIGSRFHPPHVAHSFEFVLGPMSLPTYGRLLRKFRVLDLEFEEGGKKAELTTHSLLSKSVIITGGVK